MVAEGPGSQVPPYSIVGLHRGQVAALRWVVGVKYLVAVARGRGRGRGRCGQVPSLALVKEAEQEENGGEDDDDVEVVAPCVARAVGIVGG